MSNTFGPNPFSGMAIPGDDALRAEADKAAREGITINLPGGTTRVQRGMPADGGVRVPITREDDVQYPTRIHEGHTTHSVVHRAGDGGEADMSIIGQSSYNPMSDEKPVSPELGTIRSITGRPLSIEEVQDNSVLTINGIQIQAWSAARAGFLHRSEDGKYSLPTEQAPAGPPPPEVSPLHTEHISDGVKMTLDSIDALTGSQRTTDMAVASVIGQAIDGELDKASSLLSSRTGVSPEEAANTIQAVFTEVYNSSAKVLERKYGVDDGVAAFQFIGETLPASRRTSLAQRVWAGDKTAFAEIATLYKRGQMIRENTAKDAARRSGKEVK